jgi:threonine aldolase
MAEDHANARLFAERIVEIPGIAVDMQGVQTNMVFFDVAATGLTAGEVSRKLQEQGILIGALGETRLRAVTHLDVTQADIETAVKSLRTICD